MNAAEVAVETSPPSHRLGLAAGRVGLAKVTSPFAQRSPIGPIAILLTLGAMLPFSSATLGLLRDQLHYRCSLGEVGTEAAGWTCPDGISYLVPGVVLGGTAVLLALSGLAVAALVRHDRIARVTLTLLALTAAVASLVGTRVASGGHQSPPAGELIDYWMAAVLPAGVAAGVALLVAIASLALAGRPARVLGGVAMAGLLIATILQPGLGIWLLPAIGLLIAAASRTVTR